MPPEAALAYFRSKGLKATFAWQDMLHEEHARAFTVAKMMEIDILADVWRSLDRAINEGQTFRQWANEIVPMLQARGCWGRKERVAPKTGKVMNVQLGSPRRLKVIFRTNMAASYTTGMWNEIQTQKKDAPYLLYDAVDDHRTRKEHKAWDNLVLPTDHPFWKTHYPPMAGAVVVVSFSLTRTTSKNLA